MSKSGINIILPFGAALKRTEKQGFKGATAEIKLCIHFQVQSKLSAAR